jgi:hypothetical protein
MGYTSGGGVKRTLMESLTSVLGRPDGDVGESRDGLSKSSLKDGDGEGFARGKRDGEGLGEMKERSFRRLREAGGGFGGTGSTRAGRRGGEGVLGGGAVRDFSHFE